MDCGLYYLGLLWYFTYSPDSSSSPKQPQQAFILIFKGRALKGNHSSSIFSKLNNKQQAFTPLLQSETQSSTNNNSIKQQQTMRKLNKATKNLAVSSQTRSFPAPWRECTFPRQRGVIISSPPTTLHCACVQGTASNW